MKIRELMSSQVVSIAPDESAAAAARLLSRYNIGALPVCGRDRRIYGIVTDRDIVLRCIAADNDPQTTQVRDIMTGRVVFLSPEDALSDAAEVMRREQVRRLPICEAGKLVGMLSLGDLAQRDMIEASEALCDISINLQKR